MIIVIVVTHTKKYTFKERVFMAIAWMGKATVQAALSALVLNEVKKYPNNPNFEEYYNYANN